MIEVEWNAGRVLSLLQQIQDKRLAMKAANAAAQAYRDETREFITDGHAYQEKTGKIKNSIFWRFDGPGAMVTTGSFRARYLEKGTKPHVIEPRKAKVLRLKLGDNTFGYARRVNHPGNPAMPFFFADFAAREGKMLAAAQGVLAAKLGIA